MWRGRLRPRERIPGYLKVFCKTRPRSFVTNHTRTLNFDFNQQRVPVTIGRCRNNPQTIPRSLTFCPKLIPSAAIESHISNRKRLLPRFAVHESQHENLPIARVLNNRRNQSLHFVEVNVHRSPLKTDSPQRLRDTEKYYLSLFHYFSATLCPSGEETKSPLNLRFSGP